MEPGNEARLTITAELCDRIDRIARELPHISPGNLAFAVDDIRRIACDHRLGALAGLARGLENAIAESGGSTLVLPYLEAMSDAVGCESLDPAVAQSFLASVGLRIHG